MNSSASPSDPAADLPDKSYACDISLSQLEIQKKASHAVYAALAANLGIFTIKLTFGLISHSSAMLSEAVHSLADSFNSFCLIIGLKRGNRPADNLHHFGYGLEASVWTLFACVLMFLGAIMSLYWGLQRLIVTTTAERLLDHYPYIAFALVLSLLFELWAVKNASKAVLCELGHPPRNFFLDYIKSFKLINLVKSPTTRFVWYEDTAAMFGVFIALCAVSLSRFALPEEFAHIPDGVASVMIGSILLFLAIYLSRNYLSTLGAAAKPQVEKVIKETALAINGISTIHDLKTMDLGASGLIVNMEVEVDPEIPVKDVDDITEKIQRKLITKLPNISHINIEVQADETELDWGESFEQIIKEGVQKDVLNYREGNILQNFYTFTDTTVEEVMIPRTEIKCLEKDQSISELIQLVIDTGYTRFPIYEDNIDNIIGVIHSKEVFKLFQNGGNKNGHIVADFLRDIMIVPENKSASRLLNEFIVKKQQMAIVADEHGGVAGLITIEDLLEEIFGEIWDEYDVEVVERQQIDRNTVIISSRVNIEELNERYDQDLPTEEFQTIGGYIFGRLGRVPVVGDEIRVGDVTYTVETMDSHKIVTIKMFNESGLFDQIEAEEERHLAEEDYQEEL